MNTEGAGRIDRLMNALRRRLFSSLLAEAAARMISLFLLLFLAVWLFYVTGFSPVEARLIFWPLAVLSIAYIAVKYFWIPAVHYSSDREIARLAEEREPRLRDHLLSSVELRSVLESEHEPHFSLSLTAAGVDQLTASLEKISISSVIGLESLRRAWLMALASVLLVFLAAWIYPTSVKTALAGLFGDGALASYYSGSVNFIAGDIRLTYKYPAYTGLPDMELSGSSGEIDAYPGTRVEISVRSFKNCDEGRMVMKSGRELILDRKGERSFSGELTLLEDDRYRFEFDGEADGRDHAITVKPDRAPAVMVDFPASELEEVKESDIIELAYRLEDDFGLTGAALLINYDDGTKRVDKRIELPAPPDTPRSHAAKWLWDLNSFVFQPGDRVVYRIEATDNDTVSGPKTGSSSPYYLKIFSVREHHEKLLAKQEEIWEAMIGQLATDLEAKFDAAAIPELEALKKRYTFREQELEGKIRQPASELLKELEDDPLAADAIKGIFSEIESSFLKDIQMLGMVRDDLTRYGPDLRFIDSYRTQFSGMVDKTVRDLEKFIVELKDLIAKQRYDSMVTDAEKLASLRDELRELIERYKETGDEALKEQILEKLRQFRAMLEQLKQGMAQNQKELPEEYMNMDALDTRQIDEDLVTLEKLLQADDLEAALSQLGDMSAELDQVLDSLKEGSEEMGENLYGESMQQLNELEKEVAELAKMEEEIKSRTDARYEEYKKRMGKDLSRALDNGLNRIKGKVKEARKTTGEVRENGSLDVEAYKARVLSYIDNLEKALDFKDIQEALDMAAGSASYLEILERLIKDSFAPSQQNIMERDINEKRAGSAAKLMREVEEELRRLMPDPERLLGKDEKRKLEELSQRQKQLLQEAGQMQGRIGQMSQEMPFMPPDANQRMNEARNGMDGAVQSLEQMRPGKATEQQQEALYSLEQLKQSLGEARKKMMSGMKYGGMQPGMQGEGRGRQIRKGKVAIPSADQYKTPAELREDILEAMKKPAPENYKEQNSQYYKELVK